MNEDLSLTDASDKLGVSPNYLSALIKKTKSQNFIALVTERRMKAASDLLLCTSMKIFEISQKCAVDHRPADSGDRPPLRLQRPALFQLLL